MNLNHLKTAPKLSLRTNLILIFCFSLITFAANAQSSNKSENANEDLKLMTIRPQVELNAVIDDQISAVDLSMSSPTVPEYDRALFAVYGLLLKEVKNLAPTEGLNVIATVFEKTVNEQLINPKYKTVNPEDLKHLSQYLVELLQVVPQVINTTIE